MLVCFNHPESGSDVCLGSMSWAAVALWEQYLSCNRKLDASYRSPFLKCCLGIVALVQGCPSRHLESYFPATFGCIPSPVHQNQMAEFPHQHVIKLCRGLVMTHSCD
ncbi:hypothetical protein AMECASPLE_037809 [Ameca splendens]|uniref:Uncharacterized protein n=1 Tax=Ameca splendens TaxID=208324 RepID=A0ABV0YJS2_9TELE